MATPSFAAGAYASIQGMGAGNLMRKPLATASGAEGNPDFSAMIGKALEATADSGRKADAQTASVAAGRSDIVDVVTAVAESEAAIETLVAVRDRVIAAYEEIMRMPV
ncbi:flagellar hook-basal body complex protein FliE [Bosea lathyri]|jgi:flagellar hook-basal body complex protein FliE|uniref:Flagellar hook-basal body complex protein FliE n=1 Tax=Bosea lathyri TaxID=1036778 RepID=A0A1H5XPB4_9HYPH|nr:flagellar hook-basal body complex protein FliE [Bosea lathyri]SEG13267.1 flagellar hook-basal body complex protein FliE [Bosea lathyri]